jgi:hypothetical protein
VDNDSTFKAEFEDKLRKLNDLQQGSPEKGKLLKELMAANKRPAGCSFENIKKIHKCTDKKAIALTRQFADDIERKNPIEAASARAEADYYEKEKKISEAFSGKYARKERPAANGCAHAHHAQGKTPRAREHRASAKPNGNGSGNASKDKSNGGSDDGGSDSPDPDLPSPGERAHVVPSLTTNSNKNHKQKYHNKRVSRCCWPVSRNNGWNYGRRCAA